MKFDNVSIVGVAHVDAPHRIPSEDLDARMAETYRRLGMPARLLESLTGVKAAASGMCRPSPATRPRWRTQGLGRRGRGSGAHRGAHQHLGVPRLRRAVGRVLRARQSGSARNLPQTSTSPTLAWLHRRHALGRQLDSSAARSTLAWSSTGKQSHRGRGHAGTPEPRQLRRADAARPARHVDCGVGRGCHDPGAHAPGARRASLPRRDQFGREPNTISSAGASSTSDHRHAQPVAPRRGAGAKDLGAGAKGSGLERRIRRSICLAPGERAAHAGAGPRVGFDLAKAFLIYPELGNVGPASVPMVLSKAVEAERVSPGDHVVLAALAAG